MEICFAIALYLMAGLGFGQIPAVDAMFSPKFSWWVVALFWPLFALVYLKKWCDLKVTEDD